ncbi:MAG: hypothetical protein HC822_28255, partial [Oscillochloris sp.]|nr:hypothetical protein [Oscillochloris sp.]
MPLPDLARDIAVSNGRAYVAAGSAGIQVVALDAQVAEPIGRLTTAGRAAGIRVAGSRAYVAAAGAGGGLHILDIANPTAPRLLGSAPTYGSATALDLASGLAYVAGGLGGGVEIFDVANPAAPSLRGALITPGNAQGIAVRGPRAYIAAGVCGLQILDVADPADPRLLGAVPPAARHWRSR